jgi:hypothetical protein
MRREGSHAPCKRQRPFGFDARTCTRTLAITYAHPHAQAQSITDTRSHARTRSYYLPVVNDTSQRTPTVLYAHGSCVRQGALSGSMRCRHRQVLLSEWRTPAFRSWARYTSPAALHRHLHWTSLYAAHAPRLAPRRTRVFECVAHATSQPMPIPFMHTGCSGSQRAKRYRAAGEPFNSLSRMRTAVCRKV